MNNSDAKIKYSVIILLEEKYEDFSQLINMFHEAFVKIKRPFEIVIVANGTEGFLRGELKKNDNYNSHLKAIALPQRTSQAVCLRTGFKISKGEIIIICGSYQQITMDSLVGLLDSFNDDTDIISPWRQDRVDPLFNKLQSTMFNAVVRKIIGSKQHDLNCNIKIVRRDVLEETELYGNMYRFLPVLAAKKGFKTKEVKCEHFQERGKTGFYSFSEYATRIVDIVTLFFNTHFSRKPLRFFGALGSVFIVVGVFLMGFIFLQKLFSGYPVGDRFELLLAVFFMALGVQVSSVGLLGEIIAFTHGRQKNDYTIEKIFSQ
ncbi:MAG: glycosyltransferase [Deltaproteobacteria bacterium]|nr:glycosyltransferase [Deltaproteobacteria bacterium]